MSQNSATSVLLPLRGSSAAKCRTAFAARMPVLVTHRNGDGSVEDFLDTNFLLATALHVGSPHLSGYRLTLLRCDGCKALRTEELNAGWLVPEI